ncbi:MAG: hypothetical protein AB8B64_03755 [Granulosicoccus sp.]
MKIGNHWAKAALLAGFCTTAYGDNLNSDNVSSTLREQLAPRTLLFSEAPEFSTASSSSVANSFADIEKNGLDNACYVDTDHYVAEFLYQNPGTCYWSIDIVNSTISAEAVPTAPSDAIKLPAPSGGDDTSNLEKVINQNAGQSFVGQGTYRVNDLEIWVPARIFNMPMKPWRNASQIVSVRSPDVRIYGSPIDAEDSSNTHIGFHVRDGADRFHLINSGFSNVRHQNNKSAAGVLIRGARDFHIACNRFENIINRASNKSATARANAIWMNGNKKSNASGGHIVNNLIQNLQSTGKLRDAEFFTIQSYQNSQSEKPVKLFANTGLDAGKRFVKLQTGNVKVLSNYYEWKNKQGPLGDRALLAHVEVHWVDDLIARNNRFKASASSRFDYVFITQVLTGRRIQDNIRYDCNDIEIVDKLDPNSRISPKIITARVRQLPANSTGSEATNSSANNNHIRGSGTVRYHYSFGAGYAKDGGRFETKGNVFSVPYLNAQYQ